MGEQNLKRTEVFAQLVVGWVHCRRAATFRFGLDLEAERMSEEVFLNPLTGCRQLLGAR